MEKLSYTLKQLLTNANISEAELARRTGIAQPMVNRLATGKNKNPKLETLKPIAKYFSITFSQLLGEEDLPNNAQSSDQFNISHSQVFQLPIIEFNNFDANKIASEHMVPTTAKVSNKAFALLVNDNSLSPRFPKNTMLTIEPDNQYNNNDYILINNLQNNQTNLVQVSIDKNNMPYLKHLDTSLSDTSFPYDPSIYKILGVLIQTTYDYK